MKTKKDLRAAGKLTIPVVNISGRLRETGLPRVMVDQEAMGKLAAEHFLERGFQRFGYCGERSTWYSQQRQSGFVERLARAGYPCAVMKMPETFPSHRPWDRWSKQLDEWLKGFKPPTAVMAVHDQWARLVVEGCHRMRLSVPYDVAVIGTGNDELMCEFCEVPISSISRSDEKGGYEAAALLDRLMSGKPAPKQDVLIPPEGVVTRRSTDVTAVEDPEVAAVVQYICRHLEEIDGIVSLERIIPITRRSLQRRFRHFLGRAPHEYIWLARVERAKQLLMGPEKLQLQEIARACGFRESRRLRIVFQRITGVTPAEYRRARRGDSSETRL